MTPSRFSGALDAATTRVVLANGLTVIVRRDPTAPVVAIVTHVNAGYFDERDDEVGVSHVLEHMYFKGTPTRGPGVIARETKAAGGYLNAGTIYDHTSYYVVLPSSSFAAGLAVQADAFANSLIDAGELGRELEVIVEEERRKRDNPPAVANEACYELLYDVHRMRRWRIGTPELLRKLTRDHVTGFYRRHYVPSNTILCVAGDVDANEALAEVERRYAGLPNGAAPRERGPAEPPRAGFRWCDIVRDVEQAQVVLGWRTVPPDHADTPALDVVAALLGAGRASRLYREVRERSLASVVGAYHYTPTELGVFVVSAESPSDRHGAAASAAWGQVRALATAPPGAAELARVKRGIESRWWRRLESMEGQASYLAAWEALGGWERGAVYLDSLLGVTPEEAAAVVDRYLSLDRTAMVTLRREDSEPVAADLAGARTQLASTPVSADRHREATPVEAPALVGLGVGPEQAVCGVAVYRTDGGLPILVRRKPGAPIAHIQALFPGGVIDETVARAGRTTLLARTALQGTAHRDGPQLAEDVEALGGSIGSVIGMEAFGWTLSVPTARLANALTLLAEVVEEPALPANALETERAIALAGLAQLRDDMSRQPTRLALALAFGDHAYGRPVLGSEAGLRRGSVGRLRSWHEKRVRTGQGAIFVVADASPDDVAASIRGAFRGLTYGARTTGSPVQWPWTEREAREARNKAQTAMTLLLPAPTRDDPRRRAASLLSTIASGLGGRLFEALRDRESLAYSVHVSARALRRAGWISAYLACAPSKETAARDGLLRECLRFTESRVTDEELARAKAYTLGAHAIRQQSSASVLSDIADAWLFGTLAELEDEPVAIAALTAADVHDVARSFFDPDRAVWGTVRGRTD